MSNSPELAAPQPLSAEDVELLRAVLQSDVDLGYTKEYVTQLLATLDRERQEKAELHVMLGDSVAYTERLAAGHELHLSKIAELRAENERLVAQVESMRAVVEAATRYAKAGMPGYAPGSARYVLWDDVWAAVWAYERSQAEPQEPTEYPKEEHVGD